MKILIPILLIVPALLCGCAADKSGDTQVVTPNGGVPRDAKPANASNSNIPANVKSAIPGAGK